MFRSVTIIRTGIFQLAALVVAFQLGHAVPAHAQAASATITGTVADMQGGVLPGVTVTVPERRKRHRSNDGQRSGRQVSSPRASVGPLQPDRGTSRLPDGLDEGHHARHQSGIRAQPATRALDAAGIGDGHR